MQEYKSPLSATSVQQLLSTAQDASALAAAPASEWPRLLQQRLNWLAQWDDTLAPLLVNEPGGGQGFPLKPEQGTALLDKWSLGMVEDAAAVPPNGAVVMLMGLVGRPGLEQATRRWVEHRLTAQSDANALPSGIEQARALAKWFERWGLKEAERVLLEGLQAASALDPAGRERLTQLGGEHWRGLRMQIHPQRPRVYPRSQSDRYTIEQYFKENPQAFQTLQVLRARSVAAPGGQLGFADTDFGPGASVADRFFDALLQLAQERPLRALGFELRRQDITLVDEHGEEDGEAVVLHTSNNAMSLLLTVIEAGGVLHDIQLGALVQADNGISLDAYRNLVMQVSGNESPREQTNRKVVIEAVQTALQVIKAAQRPDTGKLAG